MILCADLHGLRALTLAVLGAMYRLRGSQYSWLSVISAGYQLAEHKCAPLLCVVLAYTYELSDVFSLTGACSKAC